MNTKLMFKIASEIYTNFYTATDEQEENENLNISFFELKKDILGKKDNIVKNKLKTLQSTKNTQQVKNIINSKDNKGYTLLMLTVSNGLQGSTKQLLDMGANTTSTITINKQQLKKLIKYYENNELLSEDEINELKELKTYDATALDIAKIKNLNQIIKLF